MIEITNTVPEVLADAARHFGAKTAVLCERRDQSVSFAELDHLADLMAAALRAHGVGAGDRVGVMFRNDLEFPVAWLGILRAGATMVALNIRLTAHDLAPQLRAARPALVLAADEFAEVLRGAVDDDTRICLFDTGSRGVEAFAERLSALGEGAQPAADACGPWPESLAGIQFTSGSTGLSKGCLLSHRYWLTIGETMRRCGPKLRYDDVLLTAQPFYYMDPQWNLVASLLTGAKLVVLERFRSQTFWSSVQRHRATFFYCLGVMPSMLLSTPSTGDERVSAVRYIACSAIPTGRHAELEERFGAPWYECYGSTESGADIMVEEEDHDAALATGALGRPLPHREIRIVDDNGAVLPRGTVGRLLVRGIGMSDGYLDERHTPSSTVGNGWYATGDLARWTPDGMVHFAGREKDIIRRAGENVSAAQVEQAVETYPGVRLCACVPVADEIRGEEIKAYIVPEGDLSLDDLLRHTRERLASFKVPRYWEIRTSLPHTPSEKIAKSELRREPSHQLGRCYDAVRETWLAAVPPLPAP
jgi:carnitine-CoA ligase